MCILTFLFFNVAAIKTVGSSHLQNETRSSRQREKNYISAIPKENKCQVHAFFEATSTLYICNMNGQVVEWKLYRKHIKNRLWLTLHNNAKSSTTKSELHECGVRSERKFEERTCKNNDMHERSDAQISRQISRVGNYFFCATAAKIKKSAMSRERNPAVKWSGSPEFPPVDAPLTAAMQNELCNFFVLRCYDKLFNVSEKGGILSLASLPIAFLYHSTVWELFSMQSCLFSSGGRKEEAKNFRRA